jgi:hypothetical protein
MDLVHTATLLSSALKWVWQRIMLIGTGLAARWIRCAEAIEATERWRELELEAA